MKNKRLFFLMIIFSMAGCQNPRINEPDVLLPPTSIKNITDEKSQSSEKGWFDRAQTVKYLPLGTMGKDRSKTVKSKRITQRTCWDRRGEGRVFILAVGSNTHGLTETNRDAARFAKAMRELFNVHQNRVCVLTNVYKDEFVHALERLGDRHRVDADDLVIIFYSGHGTQLGDDNGDEKLDQLDEFFVPYSKKPRTKYLLRDDRFSVLIQAIPTPNILTFIDACFSAGLYKGDDSMEPINNEHIKYLEAATFGVTIPSSGRTRVGTTLDPIKGIQLSASRENQPAVELAERGGRFTVFFLEALKRAKQPVDLLKVFEETRNNVYQHSQRYSKKEQDPVKNGSDEQFRRINGYIP